MDPQLLLERERERWMILSRVNLLLRRPHLNDFFRFKFGLKHAHGDRSIEHSPHGRLLIKFVTSFIPFQQEERKLQSKR